MHAVSPLARGILGAFVARSWSDVYDVPLSTIANSTTRGVIRRTTSACVGGKVGLAQMIRAVRLQRRLGSVDFAGKQPWADLVARNSISRIDPAVPLMIVSAANDEVVDNGVTRRFAAEACRQGHLGSLEVLLRRRLAGADEPLRQLAQGLPELLEELHGPGNQARNATRRPRAVRVAAS